MNYPEKRIVTVGQDSLGTFTNIVFMKDRRSPIAVRMLTLILLNSRHPKSPDEIVILRPPYLASAKL